MELLGDIVVLLLIFWGMSVLISAEATSFHITNSEHGFPFFFFPHLFVLVGG